MMYDFIVTQRIVKVFVYTKEIDHIMFLLQHLSFADKNRIKKKKAKIQSK